MFDYLKLSTREEVAALNNLCSRLRLDAATAGRSVRAEMEARTDLELAALFVGYRLADELGMRGQARQDVARAAAALVAAELPGQPTLDPQAAARFRVELTHWLGLA
ncbi:hypothetical protein ACFXEL_38775 [Streptomyces sp. NPDC059382]|uniref:hypothetical protein n=1 Tax=Streptomyces sp. NPDC059382 TaxID=3346816 RepID=UPI0036A7F186